MHHPAECVCIEKEKEFRKIINVAVKEDTKGPPKKSLRERELYEQVELKTYRLESYIASGQF